MYMTKKLILNKIIKYLHVSNKLNFFWFLNQCKSKERLYPRFVPYDIITLSILVRVHDPPSKSKN